MSKPFNGAVLRISDLAAGYTEMVRRNPSIGRLRKSEYIRETRTVSYLLHPPLLDEAGLASALQWYIAGFEQRSGIRTTLDLPPALGRLSSELETTEDPVWRSGHHGHSDLTA